MLRRLGARRLTAVSAIALQRCTLPRNGLSWTVSSPPQQSSCVFQAQRFAAGGGASAKSGGAAPNDVVTIDSLNFDLEVNKSKLPTLLYFHVKTHPTVKEYTGTLVRLVRQRNQESTDMATTPTGEALGAAKPVVKLATVDCEKEIMIAQQFGIRPEMFPIIYFIWNGKVCDKMYGIIEDGQIIDALEAFVKFAAGKAPDEVHPADKPKRMDEDDENVMTLLQLGLKRGKEKDFAKAVHVLNKAKQLAEAEVASLKVRLGLDKKKVTHEVMEKLKKDPHYLALPQIYSGLAMIALNQKDMETAYSIADEVRQKFPWSMQEIKQVADAQCRINMIRITNYDVDNDTYLTLLKKDDLLNDPIDFYNNHVRLAVSHYFEQKPELAIDELLKLIRAEPKLLPELRKRGVVEEWAKHGAGPQNSSPARRVIFLLFEVLGHNNQSVMDARKKLAAYLNA